MYEVEEGATIFNSMMPLGRMELTVTHICGDVHFHADFGGIGPRLCVFQGDKWRKLREAGILKFIGYDQ